jgi:hypothetical protein
MEQPMAVDHMVWIRFHEGVGEDRIAEHLANLRSLAQRVPAVQDLRVGANFTDRARGFTHGLIVTVADRDALQQYLEHPDHVAVAGPLKEDAELMAMDIET